MTRNAIINEYFSRKFKGEKVTIESIVKSYNLSKTQLVDFAKKNLYILDQIQLKRIY